MGDTTVFGFDASFLIPGAVAIRSLDRFLCSSDQIIVFHLGLSDRQLEGLAGCVRNALFGAIECSSRLPGHWQTSPWLSNAAFLRYLAADLLPETSRCLYLDADTLVRRDPAPLFATELEDFTLAAVRSRVSCYVSSVGGVKHWRELRIPSTAAYFNSGVLLMNLDLWRSEDVVRRLSGFLARYGSSAWIPDQEALNAVLHDRWLELDRTWNYVTYVVDSFLQEPSLEPSDPHIAHFAGRRKPWIYGSSPVFADDWFNALASTPWSEWSPAAPKPSRGPAALLRRGLLSTFRALKKWILRD